MKECNKLETGCDFCCMSCEIPETEPEYCEECCSLAEEQGIDYEFNMTYRNGHWQCENCNFF